VPLFSYCRTSSPSLLHPRSVAGHLPVAVSHSLECPTSPTVDRHPRLSYCRLSSPSLLQSRPAAGRLPVAAPPPTIASPPGTAGYRPASREPTDRGAPSVLRHHHGAAAGRWPSSRIQSSPLCHPPRSPISGPSCCCWSKLLLSVQAVVIGPSCCRRRCKLLLSIPAADGPSCISQVTT
jgi:hypothetical protein